MQNTSAKKLECQGDTCSDCLFVNSSSSSAFNTKSSSTELAPMLQAKCKWVRLLRQRSSSLLAKCQLTCEAWQASESLVPR